MEKQILFLLLSGLLMMCGKPGTVFAQVNEEYNLLAKFNSVDKNSKRKIYQWNGIWSRPSRYTSSDLKIKILSAKKFRFNIDTLNGANIGNIDGIAKIKNNKAYFDDRELPKKDFEPYGCRLLFINKDNLIEIEATAECSNYGGNAVYFTGEYKRGKPPVEEQDFVERGVFSHKEFDRKFKTLVGKDYVKFLDSFHQIYPEENLDGFKAEAFSACVRGICPWMAGIIMFDEKGKIWAAVIDVDDPKKAFIRYYTNDLTWKDKLPKTIEKWVADKREFNDNLTVIFKNK